MWVMDDMCVKVTEIASHARKSTLIIASEKNVVRVNMSVNASMRSAGTERLSQPPVILGRTPLSLNQSLRADVLLIKKAMRAIGRSGRRPVHRRAIGNGSCWFTMLPKHMQMVLDMIGLTEAIHFDPIRWRSDTDAGLGLMDHFDSAERLTWGALVRAKRSGLFSHSKPSVIDVDDLLTHNSPRKRQNMKAKE